MLLTTGQADAAQTGRSLDTALAKSNQITDRAIECMDANIKTELMKHITDASPSLVVDGAIAACSHLKAEYAVAVTSPETYITPEKGTELADGLLAHMRDTYVAHVEKRLTEPELAEKRSQILTMMWGNCVREKAANWSRLTDEASTVGRAAVTSCSTERKNLHSALVYSMRAKKLPVTGADTIINSLESQMQDQAVETVISERARRLGE